MATKTATLVIASDIAPGGNVVFTYPSGTNSGQFTGAKGHRFFANQGWWDYPNFTITFNSGNITVTNPGAAIAAGTTCRLQLDQVGGIYPARDGNDSYGTSAVPGVVHRVTFGAVSAVAANTVLATTAVASTALNTLASPVTLDVPRALSIVSSNAGDTTQAVTIRGFDAYGRAMTESIPANGTTTVNGKKAFKTVVSYQSSASLAGNLSIGQTKILGLPFRIADAADVIAVSESGAAATLGTVVAGLTGASTATSADVRGTWTVNGTPNGTIPFTARVLVVDGQDLGVAQYAA